ncbi:uncharacterized mitochondrial protein AtMg00240-like [Lycium barbarum]|uniref:uncharacterized mitochondrial protein AtMg00240-like n=1 Tax=Lycium barbarum TaxID=112863 RepID=UPI00293EE182|nr:uncharacterized mitochondrial protein AtMg00240-like [Lycium barbarum]
MLEIISNTGLSGAKPVATPLEAKLKLTTVDYDEHVGVQGDEILQNVDIYQKLIGKLIYVTITRTDICFVVQLLSSLCNIKSNHIEAAMRLVRYLKGSLGMGILMKKGPVDQLEAFCDSDWASCPNTRNL